MDSGHAPSARSGMTATSNDRVLGHLEPERLAEGVAARLAGPVIAHVALAHVLGEQRGQQHVAALRAGGKPDLSGLGSEGAEVVREHDEASSAAAATSPSDVPTDQDYAARPWRANEPFVKLGAKSLKLK